jgi:hypothetical protein
VVTLGIEKLGEQRQDFVAWVTRCGMSVYSGRFEGRTAIITGGASGLGKASRARIVAEGGKVVLWDLNAEALAAAKVDVGATTPWRWTSPIRPRSRSAAKAAKRRWADRHPRLLGRHHRARPRRCTNIRSTAG